MWCDAIVSTGHLAHRAGSGAAGHPSASSIKISPPAEPRDGRVCAESRRGTGLRLLRDLPHRDLRGKIFLVIGVLL